MACAKLHNYVIDCQLKAKKEQDDMLGTYNDGDDDDDDITIDHVVTQLVGAPLGLQYLLVLPDEEFEVIRGVSMTRLAIIQEIKKQNYQQPVHNIDDHNSNILDADSNSYIVPRDKDGTKIAAEFFHPT